MAYSNNQIIDALQKTEGNIAAAARALGCSRVTIHNRLNKSEEVKQAYDSVNEANLDRAENELMELVKDKEHKDHFQALKFYLRTKGKRRGFSDSLQLEHTGEIQFQKIERQIIDPEDE